MELLTIIPIILTLLAAAFLVFAWRGRPVGDHPYCRRCRFDLYGQPGATNVCPECGADLKAEYAVVRGQRQRNPHLVTAAVAALLPCLALCAAMVYSVATDTNWEAHKPVWWVLHEARTGPVSASDVAWAELVRRLRADALSDAQVQRVAVDALDLQGDTARPWTFSAGDFVEAARGRGHLSQELWVRYATQAIATANFKIEVRPNVRLGDQIPVRFSVPSARVGTLFSLHLHVKLSNFEIGGVAAVNSAIQFESDRPMNPSSSGSLGSMLTLPRDLSMIPSGDLLSVQVKMTASVTDQQSFGGTGPRPPLATRESVTEASFTLHPADQPTVKAIYNPSLAAKVRASLRATWFRVGSPVSPYNFSGMIEAVDAPVDMAFAVYLRPSPTTRPAGGSAETAPLRPVGSVSIRAGSGSSGYGVGGSLPAPYPSHVDVVLRPSARVAAETVDLAQYWNGEVVLRNVPVESKP